MATLMTKKPVHVEFRVMSSGSPKNGFFERAPTVRAFPGVIVPEVFRLLAGDVHGQEIDMPTLSSNPTEAEIASYKASLEKGVRDLWDTAVGTKAQVNGKRWVLLEPYIWTSSEKIRWRDSYEAVAAEVGLQALTITGQVDNTAPVEAYRQDYDNGVTACFWAAFTVA